jgi:hypothetical protein
MCCFHLPLDRIGRFDFQSANSTSLLIRFNHSQTKCSNPYKCFPRALDDFLGFVERVATTMLVCVFDSSAFQFFV